jgi:hypothetical protein
MDAKVAGLIRVFDGMTPGEQREAIRRLNEYIDGGSTTKQRILNESDWERVAKRVDLGPVGRVCPYCGRSN